MTVATLEKPYVEATGSLPENGETSNSTTLIFPDMSNTPEITAERAMQLTSELEENLKFVAKVLNPEVDLNTISLKNLQAITPHNFKEKDITSTRITLINVHTESLYRLAHHLNIPELAKDDDLTIALRIYPDADHTLKRHAGDLFTWAIKRTGVIDFDQTEKLFESLPKRLQYRLSDVYNENPDNLDPDTFVFLREYFGELTPPEEK